MPENIKNNAKSFLTEKIDASTQYIPVEDRTKFPSPDFRLLINDELLLITGYSGYSGQSGYSGNILVGSRGVEGTTPAPHNELAVCENVLTAEGLHSWLTGGQSGYSGYSGQTGAGSSGISGYSGKAGESIIGQSGISGYSGYSGTGSQGISGYSGKSGFSGYSGKSGIQNPLVASINCNGNAVYGASYLATINGSSYCNIGQYAINVMWQDSYGVSYFNSPYSDVALQVGHNSADLLCNATAQICNDNYGAYFSYSKNAYDYSYSGYADVSLGIWYDASGQYQIGKIYSIVTNPGNNFAGDVHFNGYLSTKWENINQSNMMGFSAFNPYPIPVNAMFFYGYIGDANPQYLLLPQGPTGKILTIVNYGTSYNLNVVPQGNTIIGRQTSDGDLAINISYVAPGEKAEIHFVDSSLIVYITPLSSS
jgi:hypothetical protein